MVTSLGASFVYGWYISCNTLVVPESVYSVTLDDFLNSNSFAINDDALTLSIIIGVNVSCAIIKVSPCCA